MPGPEPQYESDADRQRAYRQRNRERLRERLRNQRRQAAELKAAAEELHAVVQLAAVAGDDQADQVRGEDPKETIQNLTHHFKSKAGTPPGS